MAQTRLTLELSSSKRCAAQLLANLPTAQQLLPLMPTLMRTTAFAVLMLLEPQVEQH
jgi:hypothetical protein